LHQVGTSSLLTFFLLHVKILSTDIRYFGSVKERRNFILERTVLSADFDISVDPSK